MPGTRLTDDQIAEVRKLYAMRGEKTYGVATIASMFRTSKAVIHRIVRDAPRGRRGWDNAWDNDRPVDGPRLDHWERL